MDQTTYQTLAHVSATSQEQKGEYSSFFKENPRGSGHGRAKCRFWAAKRFLNLSFPFSGFFCATRPITFDWRGLRPNGLLSHVDLTESCLSNDILRFSGNGSRSEIASGPSCLGTEFPVPSSRNLVFLILLTLEIRKMFPPTPTGIKSFRSEHFDRKSRVMSTFSLDPLNFNCKPPDGGHLHGRMFKISRLERRLFPFFFPKSCLESFSSIF